MFGFSPIKIKESVGNGFTNTHDDVLSIKSGLSRLGLYKPLPRAEINGILDHPLVDGMKRFQKQNGLRVDGSAKPNGPTIAALGRELTRAGGSPINSPKNAPENAFVAKVKKKKLPPEVFTTVPVEDDEESILKKAGFDYVSDSIGRLGQGHFEDKDGRKLDQERKLQVLAEARAQAKEKGQKGTQSGEAPHRPKDGDPFGGTLRKGQAGTPGGEQPGHRDFQNMADAMGLNETLQNITRDPKSSIHDTPEIRRLTRQVMNARNLNELQTQELEAHITGLQEALAKSVGTGKPDKAKTEMGNTLEALMEKLRLSKGDIMDTPWAQRDDELMENYGSLGGDLENLKNQKAAQKIAKTLNDRFSHKLPKMGKAAGRVLKPLGVALSIEEIRDQERLEKYKRELKRRGLK